MYVHVYVNYYGCPMYHSNLQACKLLCMYHICTLFTSVVLSFYGNHDEHNEFDLTKIFEYRPTLSSLHQNSDHTPYAIYTGIYVRTKLLPICMTSCVAYY